MSRRLLLRSRSDAAGCEIVAVENGVDAERRLERERFGAVLVARDLPDADAFTRLAHWRRQAGHGRRCCFVLDRCRTAPEVARARRAGAVDVVARPRSAAETHRLVLRLGQAGGFACAPQGAPIGFRGSPIPNNDRTCLVERISVEVADASALREPLALGLLGFENLPDLKIEHGREFGEGLLAQLEDLVLENVRAGDFVARNTGSEIVLLMPYTDRRGASVALARLGAAIARRSFALEIRLEPVAGVSTIAATRGDARSLLNSCLADVRARSTTHSP